MFKDFTEYYHFLRHLKPRQRDMVFEALSADDKKSLARSYKRGGWEDLVIRNNTDEIMNSIKKQYDIDLMDIRIKVYGGKSVYLSKALWEAACNAFGEIDDTNTSYIFGGIDVIEENDETVLLVKNHDFYTSKPSSGEKE